MKKIAALFALSAVAALASGCAAQRPGMGGMMPGGAMAGTPSGQMRQQMMSGMQQMQSMPLSGNTDRDFIVMMRQHHLSGIDMARVEVQHGSDPEATQMARKIIDSQQRDVKEFDEWLQKHR